MISNIKELPVPSEHYEQVELFRWLKAKMLENPDYGLAYAIPNGGKRNKKTAVDLQAEGVKSGVPDVCVPVPRYPYHGLYVEMKRIKKSSISTEQKALIARLKEQGYRVEVCKGAESARWAIESYLKLPTWDKILEQIKGVAA